VGSGRGELDEPGRVVAAGDGVLRDHADVGGVVLLLDLIVGGVCAALGLG
jgi:hypothetical protein